MPYIPQQKRTCPKCGRGYVFGWDAVYWAVLTDDDWAAIRAAKATS